MKSNWDFLIIIISIFEKKNVISRNNFGYTILSTNFNRIWFYHSREFCCVRKFIINWNIMFVPVRKLIKFSLTHYIGLMWISAFYSHFVNKNRFFVVVDILSHHSIHAWFTWMAHISSALSLLYCKTHHRW